MNNSIQHDVNEPCEHVKQNKKDALHTYEILHAYFVACIARTDALDLKKKFVKCVKRCKEKSNIHACLFCKYFGCFAGHIQNHAEKRNHSLSMDTSFGVLFCYECKDFQYDRDFENIARKQLSSPVCPRGLIYNKRTPSIDQVNILKEHRIIDITEIALRGFLNLGNICFGSCIFQALIHAPVFRNYFLSLKHKCDSKRGPVTFRDTILENMPSCYLCEISNIVLECFSGETESVVPSDFMHLIWTHESEGFKANDMNDAHLFYLHLVENLHSALQGKSSSGIVISDQNCHCDIDVMFSGSYKNVVTCKECRNSVSQTQQFKSVHFNSKPELKEGSIHVTFKDCLEKNLQSVVEGYDCKICNIPQTAECETIYEKLPLICCFQLNISRGAFTDKKAKKNDGLIVRFEEYFDMTPYKYSLEERNKRCGNLDANPYNFFYLFAVVEFKSKSSCLESQDGHYISYVRRNRSNWFKCDDENIEQITLDEVKRVTPYLLFYQRPVDECSRLLLSRTPG